MSELNKIITTVSAKLRTVDAECGSYSDDPSGFHLRKREALVTLCTDLSEEFGATFNDRWDGAKVRIAGIPSSSTSGLGGALSNWLIAARKRMAAE